MEDHRTLENVLKLLNKLAAKKRYTPDEVAEMLGVSSRTAYRYLTTLGDVGYSLQKEKGAYFIPSEDKAFSDISQLVHFTEEEEALVYDIMQRLSSDAVMQRNLKSKMAAVFDLDAVAKSVTETAAYSSLAKIIAAIKNEKYVCLKGYHSGNSDRVTDRVVEPFSLLENYSVLWAYEPASHKNKIFKLSRVDVVEEMDKHWLYKSSHQAEEADAFRSYGPLTYNVNLSFDLLVYNLLIEEYPATRNLIRKNGDTFTLNTKVARLDTVGRFVLGLIDHIRIVDSPELKAELQRRITCFK